MQEPSIETLTGVFMITMPTGFLLGAHLIYSRRCVHFPAPGSTLNALAAAGILGLLFSVIWYGLVLLWPPLAGLSWLVFPFLMAILIASIRLERRNRMVGQ